ncbi:trypsin 3A1-like [Belonocnema kinseyi]|uniref:trypsin 3A1-like n=1 Tax=Belonocnema kinseyi TaxID=2817044 RepID=UPI00143D7A2A|nr:trypsin 3A1-like [Belonocnema kinseyi]
MERYTYLSFLIFCGILFKLIGILSQEIEIPELGGKSLDLHPRQKRLVNKYTYENIAVPIEHVPYIVNILGNGATLCGGSIITPITILSAAHCFVFFGMDYKIISGSNRVKNGTVHKIIRKIIPNSWNYKTHASDLALLIISPAIDLIAGPNRRIALYDRNIAAFSHGTLSGWGCHKVIMGLRFRPTHLRSTTIPIISQEECQKLYGNRTKILPTHICTYDRSHHRGACAHDDGGPLALLGKQIGVLARNRMVWNPPVELPDVFINVADPDIRHWIYSNAQYVY